MRSSPRGRQRGVATRVGVPEGCVTSGLDENRSVWVAEGRGAAPGGEARGAGSSADVAIVGGGFTGVSTAWHLRAALARARHRAARGARRSGNGASGRNGGQVLHWINGVTPRRPESTAPHPRRDAASGSTSPRSWPRATRRPGAFRRQRLPRGLHRSAAGRGGAHATRRGAGARPASRRSSCRRARSACTGAHGAMLDPLAGRLNGFALLQALRAAAASRAASRVYEDTPVVRVRDGAEIALETPDGEVRARALVLATNGYTPALGFFRRGILPLHSHVLATAPLPQATGRRIGWGAWDGFSDDFDRIAYACRTPGGRLLFGGGGNPAYAYRFGGAPAIDARATTTRADALPATPRCCATSRRSPATPIAQRWSGHARHHTRPRLLDGRRRRAPQRLSRARLQRSRRRARAARGPRARRSLRRRPRSLARPALLPEAPAAVPARAAALARLPGLRDDGSGEAQTSRAEGRFEVVKLRTGRQPCGARRSPLAR